MHRLLQAVKIINRLGFPKFYRNYSIFHSIREYDGLKDKLVSVGHLTLIFHNNDARRYMKISRTNPGKTRKVSIEEDEILKEKKPQDKYLSKFMHTLKTNDISSDERKRKLAGMLRQYLSEVKDTGGDPRVLRTLNKVFLDLYDVESSDAKEIKKLHSGPLNNEELVLLFTKSFKSIEVSHKGRIYVPEYFLLLSKYFMEGDTFSTSNEVLRIIVIVGTLSGNSLQVVLQYVLNNSESISSQFFTYLAEYYVQRKCFNITVVEQILQAVNTADRRVPLNNEFYSLFIDHVEKLYQDKPPAVHEYVDLNRNIEKVQFLTNHRLLRYAINDVSLFMRLRLAKLSYELNLANYDEGTNVILDDFLRKKLGNDAQDLEENLNEMKNIIFKQNLGDETFAETLLAIIWALGRDYTTACSRLCKFIISDEVKFSIALRLQCKVYECLSETSSISGNKTANDIIGIIDKCINSNESESSLDIEDLVDKITFTLLLLNKVDPNGAFFKDFDDYFRRKHNIEPTVYSYKFRIDKAIHQGDFRTALEIFESSSKNCIKFPGESDPMIRSTLFRLIITLCKGVDQIDQIFPHFVKIKQNLVGTPCSTDVIISLSKKMLAAEYVGDTIEMLKRELPKIDKEAANKLPLEGVEGRKYRQLFDQLFGFITTYKNEKSFETNWVLYGELHKYFNVPFESYLPAMKFFCEQDRLNAALIIFRQMRKLSELHGNHRNLPPLKAIYKYLFQVFGDKLYEEGVEEVHEYLKLDVNIPKQDVLLQNCILNAYSNLQEVGKANDLFFSMATIPKSEGGINEETVQIMIKTYTYSDLLYVQKFWNNLSTFEVIPDYGIYKQYVIAHVYYGQVEEAFNLIEEMKDYDLKVSGDTLLAMHNFCLDSSKQAKIAEWAKENYGKEWQDAVGSGLIKAAEKYMPESNLIKESEDIIH